MKREVGIMVLAAALVANGCALFLVGAGGLTGYAISKDEVEGFLSAKKSDKIWREAVKAVEQRGHVKMTNKEIGRLEAVVDGSLVKIDIEQISEDTTRLRVQARKGLNNILPDLDLAHLLYTEIAKKA